MNLLRFFVGPPGEEDPPAEIEPEPVYAPHVVLLATPSTAAAACGAVVSRVAGGFGVVLVLAWRAEAPVVGLPALPFARRLARWACERGVEARAFSRICWVRLPDEADEAVHVAHRLAAAVEVPVVVALCGPRTPACDLPLGDADRRFVAELADPALTDLVLDELAARGPSERVVLPAGWAGRWAASQGLVPGVPPEVAAAVARPAAGPRPAVVAPGAERRPTFLPPRPSR